MTRCRRISATGTSPFALNESTRFISPTKTLEYLAGGKPVVSTPIRDVVTPYGEQKLVHVAGAPDFADAVDAALTERFPEQEVNAVLSRTSWQSTWQRMSALIGESAIAGRQQGRLKSQCRSIARRVRVRYHQRGAGRHGECIARVHESDLLAWAR